MKISNGYCTFKTSNRAIVETGDEAKQSDVKAYEFWYHLVMMFQSQLRISNELFSSHQISRNSGIGTDTQHLETHTTRIQPTFIQRLVTKVS